MSLPNAIETSLLQLIFNATAWNNIAENDSSSPATQFFVSLHTASPGETGSQTTNETAYTSYARQAVARTTAGFTVTGASVANAAAVTFPESGGNGDTVVDFGVGLSLTGAGTLVAYGDITSPASGLSTGAGVQPQFGAGALTLTVD